MVIVFFYHLLVINQKTHRLVLDYHPHMDIGVHLQRDTEQVFALALVLQ